LTPSPSNYTASPSRSSWKRALAVVGTVVVVAALGVYNLYSSDPPPTPQLSLSSGLSLAGDPPRSLTRADLLLSLQTDQLTKLDTARLLATQSSDYTYDTQAVSAID